MQGFVIERDKAIHRAIMRQEGETDLIKETHRSKEGSSARIHRLTKATNRSLIN